MREKKEVFRYFKLWKAMTREANRGRRSRLLGRIGVENTYLMNSRSSLKRMEWYTK
jgi:hypothetical protein